MAKILVSGGAGFIGSHTVDLFISHRYEVVIVDDLSTYLNADKAKRALEWAPTIGLEDGLRETVEYFKTSERAI